jgi:5-methylcytosine-specific restriction endonuclease McrBC regulatory subunit McrC
MCMTNVKTNIYYANICKHEHEQNMLKLWCKIVLKTSVEQTKKNERFYFYLYPFEDPVQKNFQGGFYVCIK